MRRKEREMDYDFGLYVIDKSQYAVLAMINAVDKTPYCVPVSAVRIDNSIYFHCALAGQKIDNLNADPNVCLSFVGDVNPISEQYTTEYESAIVKGKAENITDEKEKIEALRAICLKYAANDMDKFDSAISRSLSRTGIWKIEIKELTAKRKKNGKDGKELTYGKME